MIRWWVGTLLFLVTVINFIDRLSISVLAPVITVQLGLTNLQFAEINTWFLVAYALSQGLSGKLFDRVGTRRGFQFAVSLWSVASMAHGFVRGFASLSATRLVLGIGEGGNWPGAAKAVAEWFDVRERALGIAIVNSASALGSVIAPPLIVWLQMRYGWRTTFVSTGALGFLWLILWKITYRVPEVQAESADMASRGTPWRVLLKYPQTWAIIAARFLMDPVWWLYITWLPLYLYNVRGFSLKQIGLFAWVPYVAAGAGSVAGGWLPSLLIGRGWTVDHSRKLVLVIGAVLMSAGILVAVADRPWSALAFIGVVLFGFQSAMANVQTMPSDYFPNRVVASVAGLGGLGAGAGAILLTLATGFVVDKFHSYTPILVTTGLLPALGIVALFALGGPIRKLEFNEGQ